MENWDKWLFAITAVVSASTAITAITPTKTDNRVIGFVLAFLNILAGNVGKNQNKDA